MIGIILKALGSPEGISRAEACISTLEREDISEQERKNLMNEMRSINLDSSFWTVAALYVRGENLRKLCAMKAFVASGKEKRYPIMRFMHSFVTHS